MNKFTNMLGGNARHVLTFGGGMLIASGWGDPETVQEVIGAATTLVGFMWSMVEKAKR